MEELFKGMEKQLDEQIEKLDDLRARVAKLDDDSAFFTKEAYLTVLDAYINCEKQHHKAYREIREILS